jgi:hypothetical protein
MESRFGHDFSRVRVHADGKAAESARAVNARAYTVGPNIVFGAGQYEPSSIKGQRLLAHELAHTVQQGGADAGGETALRGHQGAGGNSAEREAEQAAQAVTGGRRVGSISPTTPRIAREKKAAGTVEALPGYPNWTYVVYAGEVRLRYYDPGPKGQPETQIGTIPWVTNNPGNMGVIPNVKTEEGKTPDPSLAAIPEKCKNAAAKPEEKVTESSIQALPLKLGAIGLYNCRYAVFPTLQKGMDALLPYLRALATKSKKPDMTVEEAFRNFKGLEPKEKEALEKGGPDPRVEYVQSIKDYMFNTLMQVEAMEGGGEVGDLDPAQLKTLTAEVKGRIKKLMSTKITDVRADDTDLYYGLKGLVRKEGINAPPGLRFTCSGFDATLNPPNLYDGKQKQIMKNLKESADANAKLRSFLDCK